ncbi:MAG: hypothetical protein GC145_18150 [Caulobacter sp.]|nr:hypothetical protein [Caulobacter sp.]
MKRMGILVAALALAGCAAERIYGENYAGPRENRGSAYTPERALNANVGGRVLLICEATGDQGVKNCIVGYENPVDWGFGKAALDMQPKLTTKSHGTLPKGQKVVVPVLFCQAEGPCRPPPLPDWYLKRRDGATPRWPTEPWPAAPGHGP